MNSIVQKVAFVQNVEIDIEINETPQMSDPDSDIFYISDVVEALTERAEDNDLEIVDTLKKLKENGVDMVAINKQSI